jgi:hypothetical protein
MQHGDLDKTKVLKTQRDSKSDERKPNSKSVLKSILPVRPVLHTGQTGCTCFRTSPVHQTWAVLYSDVCSLTWAVLLHMAKPMATVALDARGAPH